MGLDSVINVSIMLVVNVSIMPVSLYGKIVMMSEQQTTLSQGLTISPNYSTVHIRCIIEHNINVSFIYSSTGFHSD